MLWADDEVFCRLKVIEYQQLTIIGLLRTIINKENKMSAELDALTAQVAANATVEGSALTLIQGLAAQIATAVAANDGPALTALSGQLAASAGALAAAVAANTPAAPAAPVAPTA